MLKKVLVMVMVLSAASWAQEEVSIDNGSLAPMKPKKVLVAPFVASSEVVVIGGNLPKNAAKESTLIRYVGTFIDAQGHKRQINLLFRPDLQEVNRWVMQVEVGGFADLQLFLRGENGEEMADFDKVWLDFNNQGQLARLLDMAGEVRESDDATIYLQYNIEGELHQLALNFGELAKRGNFLTQFNGKAQATLKANGYTTLNI